MDNDDFSSIESVYDSHGRFSRYAEDFGPTAKGLGWGSEDLMVARLNQIVEAIVSRHHCQGVEQLIDLGCGYGLLLYLMRSRIPVARYLGIDFVEKNIEFAHSLFRRHSFPENSFELSVGDFRHFDETGRNRSQIVISGLFNHSSTDLRLDDVGQAKIQHWIDNGHVLYINFLSNQATRKSPNLAYTDPEEILSLFHSVTPSVRNEFSPYEFLLIMESAR